MSVLTSTAIPGLITNVETGETHVPPGSHDTRALYLALGSHWIAVQRTKAVKSGDESKVHDLNAQAEARGMEIEEGIAEGGMFE